MGFNEHVVVAFADTHGGGLQTSLDQSLRMADLEVLYAAVTAINRCRCHAEAIQCLLKHIRSQCGAQRVRHPPAYNPSSSRVDRERQVDQPAPSREVSEIRHPQRFRPRHGERYIHPFPDTCRSRCRHRRIVPAPTNRTVQAQSTHQPLHIAASHPMPFSIQLLPDIARTDCCWLLRSSSPSPRSRAGCKRPRGVVRAWRSWVRGNRQLRESKCSAEVGAREQGQTHPYERAHLGILALERPPQGCRANTICTETIPERQNGNFLGNHKDHRRSNTINGRQA